MALHGGERSALKTSPMQIAHNPLFTAREKIEMLNELKAEVTGHEANPDHLGFEPEEIDAAIAEIRQEVQDGTRPTVSIAGDVYGHHE